MNRLLLAAIATAAAAGLTSCAAKATPAAPAAAGLAPAPAAPASDPVVAEAAAVTATATVEKIDQKTRMVTLRGPEGRSTTFRVDDRVKNLPQVKKGDEVVATFYESIAVRLEKPGEGQPGAAVATEVSTAAPGQKPAGVGASTVSVTATISAIDTAKSTITLTGPEGKSITLKVRDPQHLTKVKTGDLLQITYTEAVAIAVEKPAKNKK